MTRRRAPLPDLPLLRRGDQQPAEFGVARRSRGWLLATGVPIGLLASTLLWHPPIRLVWNASASAPIGLYRVSDPIALHRGDMVVSRVPAPFRGLAASRGYIPANVPLIKRIAAAPGDEVCALGNAIYLNGTPAVIRRSVDGHGRPLPTWSGCRILARTELLLLMSESPKSFDGRYFGPSQASDIIGKATPLWVR